MDYSNVDRVGLDRVIERGTADILEQQDNALLIRDRVSGAVMLLCDDVGTSLSLLDRHIGRDCDLLVTSHDAPGQAAFARYGFAGKLECYQVAYYGAPPATDPRLTVRTATERDLPLLTEHYHLLSPDDLQTVVQRGAVLLGYEGDRLIGFIGEHLEGSMGLLFVLPEYRHRGFGTALEHHQIARMLEQGIVPFGQVAADNRASLLLQKKLGMTQSDHVMVWMWR